MIAYMLNNYGKLLNALFAHLELVILSLIGALVIVSILVLLCMVSRRFEKILLSLLSILYTIPSVSLLAIFIPITGLGFNTAVLTLMLYNLYLLSTTILQGFHTIDSSVLESAAAMGMNPLQCLARIKLPLAKRSILTGLRLSVVSSIQTATIAAVINANGLGTLLFDGLRTMNMNKILWGSILSALLAVGFHYCFLYFEKKVED